MSENSHLVFSYGTLKRSQRNHDVMSLADKGKSSFVGSGETVCKYPLVVGTKFEIPFMINMENQGHNIVGEVYEVDDKMLSFLDEFEGHPHLYNRQQISILVTVDKDGHPVHPASNELCWTYFLTKVDDDMFKKEWLKEFTDTVTHIAPLAERMKIKDEIEEEMIHKSVEKKK